ncbi:putative hyaluronidase [Streptomyces sp. W007]|nr:putative hyaluronidase [Streptomyces sp. W007]
MPWFGDEPAATLDLTHGETDAEIGGESQRVAARLAGRRPVEVKGKLTAKAPEGIEVRVPKQTTVPRGSRTDVPVDITVPADTPAGEYEVPLTFGGQESTLTVRAFPVRAARIWRVRRRPRRPATRPPTSPRRRPPTATRRPGGPRRWRTGPGGGPSCRSRCAWARWC